MKERPILMSAPMVLATLDDRKTITRRICKAKTQAQADRIGHAIMLDMMGKDNGTHERAEWEAIGCPYGKPGDRLWVKETWRTDIEYDPYPPTKIDGEASVIWTADGQHRLNHDHAKGTHKWGRTRVSIHMPRWASRITLEIVSTRVERLWDISPNNCWAEGIGIKGRPLQSLSLLCSIYPLTNIHALSEDDGSLFTFGGDEQQSTEYQKVIYTTPRGVFAYLWESINGPQSWKANPFVWVVEFRRIQP